MTSYLLLANQSLTRLSQKYAKLRHRWYKTGNSSNLAKLHPDRGRHCQYKTDVITCPALQLVSRTIYGLHRWLLMVAKRITRSIYCQLLSPPSYRLYCLTQIAIPFRQYTYSSEEICVSNRIEDVNVLRVVKLCIKVNSKYTVSFMPSYL